MIELLIVPGSPALIAELSPADAPSARLRAAARALLPVGAGAEIDIVGSRAQRWHTARDGSLAAWGAPGVDVGEGNFLPELIARYLYPGARVRDSRARVGVLQRTTVVVIDGSAGLTDRAPLALRAGADRAHEWCQELLRGADPAPMSAAELDAAGVLEPELWMELARLEPARAQLVAADESLGVGRYVACWQLDQAVSGPIAGR